MAGEVATFEAAMGRVWIACARRDGAAGEFSFVQLFNPATGSKLLVVNWVKTSTAASGASIRWAIATSLIAGADQAIRSNLGDAYNGDAVCRMATDADRNAYLSAGAEFGQMFADAAPVELWPRPLNIYVVPGRGVTLLQEPVNAMLAASFFFTERHL